MGRCGYLKTQVHHSHSAMGNTSITVIFAKVWSLSNPFSAALTELIPVSHFSVRNCSSFQVCNKNQFTGLCVCFCLLDVHKYTNNREKLLK